MAVHPVQLDVARMRAPLDHPIVREFVAWLEPLNGFADSGPGFVWRLQTEEGTPEAFPLSRTFPPPPHAAAPAFPRRWG